MQTTTKRSGYVLSLAIAILLAWAFLAFFAAQQTTVRAIMIAKDMMPEVTQVPAVKYQILGFIAAELLLHTALGVGIWVLAAASQRAYPRRAFSMVHYVAGWAAMAFVAIYLVNAALIPKSRFAGMHAVLNSTPVVTVTVSDLVISIVCVLIATVLVRAAWSFDFVRRHARRMVSPEPRRMVRTQARRIVVYGLVAMAAVFVFQVMEPGLATDATHERPHVIVVGIDSLRPDLVGNGHGLTLTPNVSWFMRSATTFDDVTTPLARTFPSWVTILSGQHPVRSGARDNLMPASLLHVGPTLAQQLRASGYATAYATDEVRYSSIDQSFGFDRVMTPRIGAADFLVPRWADLPWSNLFANTRVAEWLLPNIYGNRAASKFYRPSTFVEWVDRNVDFSRPTFLAVHLTLAHLPYVWGDLEGSADWLPEPIHQYSNAVIGVDRQFGELMRALQRRGALDNAIVVVLSDHGEALGLPQDNLIRSEQFRAAVGLAADSMNGHGTGVLSTSQYQVLLAIRRPGRYAGSGGSSAQPPRSLAPASLEDLAPTLLTMLGMPYDPANFDGVSLAGELTSGRAAVSLTSRVRFVETGLTTTAMRAGNFSEAANAKEALRFYTVDAETGRVMFRPERMNFLLGAKERAAISGEWLLAAIPEPGESHHKYILINRAGGAPRIVTDDPQTVDDSVFAELWQAMRRRFGPELGAPTEQVSATRSPAS